MLSEFCLGVWVWSTDPCPKLPSLVPVVSFSVTCLVGTSVGQIWGHLQLCPLLPLTSC